jgi:hypothetical protein
VWKPFQPAPVVNRRLGGDQVDVQIVRGV